MSAVRIAVCDDATRYRRALTYGLGLVPEFELVGEASNGRRAIELVREEAPDVLLLDVAMPIMDGIEALPAIRAASPATRIVMLTGFADEQTRQRALAAGADLYLEKGADIGAIEQAVRQSVESRG